MRILILLSCLITIISYGKSLPPDYCIYNQYPGDAEVLSITKTAVSKAQKERAGFEGYEILFKLNVKTDGLQKELKKSVQKPYLFLLNNGWYPGDAYIKKYAVKVGKKYPGVLKIRRQGNCPRPIFFDEPTLKKDDYFEGYLTQPYLHNPELMINVDKPVIYLYPEKKQAITVKLLNNKNLRTTYPKYPKDGWRVIAEPDGTLTDLKTKKKYYTLFWDAKDLNQFKFTEGSIVSGKDAAQFLEKSLTKLGLNWRERNEFIIYWLPKLEQNQLNLVRFVTKEYTDRYPLKITPKPDTLIRVYMIVKKIDAVDVLLKPQILTAIKRSGYTVVEWGGSEVI